VSAGEAPAPAAITTSTEGPAPAAATDFNALLQPLMEARCGAVYIVSARPEEHARERAALRKARDGSHVTELFERRAAPSGGGAGAGGAGATPAGADSKEETDDGDGDGESDGGSFAVLIIDDDIPALEAQAVAAAAAMAREERWGELTLCTSLALGLANLRRPRRFALALVDDRQRPASAAAAAQPPPPRSAGGGGDADDQLPITTDVSVVVGDGFDARAAVRTAIQRGLAEVRR
jgi:hypothetical protein